MQKWLLLALALLAVCPSGDAQELSPEAFVSLVKKSVSQIDSLLTQKGFEKKVLTANEDFDITTYAYLVKTDTGVIQRSLHVGWRKKLHILELQYGLWQRREAVTFIDELLKQGFTRHVVSTPDLGGGSGPKLIYYQKNQLHVDYKETDQGDGVNVFIFTIDNDHYR